MRIVEVNKDFIKISRRFDEKPFYCTSLCPGLNYIKSFLVSSGSFLGEKEEKKRRSQ
jgi:hypothetical protein